MKILITGSGGREHAIGKKISENPKVEKIFFAPGNGGTSDLGENIAVKDMNEMADFAQKNQIDLTIVGSEDLLVAGIVDVFQERGLQVFGPDKRSAQLEGSKSYSKWFMKQYGIKTGDYEVFEEVDTAKRYVDKQSFPTVIKASGLAAGKGVVIAENRGSAHRALDQAMVEKKFGTAGDTVVVEEFLQGFEVSVISIYNGNEIIPFLPVKDHKQIYDGNKGPNTGGMGVVAPHPFYTKQHHDDFIENILLPTQHGLKEEGMDFKGVIFFGLMCTDKGVHLLEYNLRFGDPEAQILLTLMKSDFLQLIQTSMRGEKPAVEWSSEHACLVVLSSGGYPASYSKGHEIKGLENVACPFYIAGATKDTGLLKTSGGRVLNVVGLGKDLGSARAQAYENVQKIDFEACYCRTDIGIAK